jgi:hypothetical protein
MRKTTMPLPTPEKNENETDFIARCVADDTVKNDFADQKQRLAVCYSQWGKGKQQGSVTVRYCVRAQAIEQAGKRYAVIEVIDESENRKKWRINPAGKARALAGVLEKPLLGPPELGHEATEVVGRPVDFTSNHATRVLYEISDPAVWERIRSGEWGPVSPQLTPLAAHYEDDTFVIDDWTWDHVAFVPVGAFPNAGVKSTCIGDPRLYGFSHAVAAAAADFSKSRLKAGRPGTETDVAGYSHNRQPDREKTEGPPGGVTMEKDKESEKEVIAELTDAKTKLETKLADMKTKAAELTEANKKLDDEVKELKAKAAPPVAASDATVTLQAELKAVKAECDALKAWKVAAEDADHMRRVQDVVDLRVKAGLLETKAVQAAVESLKKLPNDALDTMKADLDAVKAKFDSLPSGPKARLIPTVAGARFDPMQPTVGDLVGKKPGEK